MSQMSHSSSLGRPLDPRYPTNLAIMILTVLAGIASGVLHLVGGDVLGDSAYAGLISAVLTIAAWVITREIDPDNPYSAFVSAGIAFVASFFIGFIYALALYGVIFLTRILNRTVGPPASLADTFVVLVVSIVIVFSGQWWFGLVAALTFLMDARLENPLTLHYVAAPMVALAAVIYLLLGRAAKMGDLSPETVLIAGLIFLLFAIHTARLKAVHSTADVMDLRLDLRRVQAAMLIAALIGIGALWHGDSGLIGMTPLWASMLGVVVYRVAAPFFGADKPTM